MLSLRLLILVFVMTLIGSIVIQSFQITPTWRHAPKTTASMICDIVADTKNKDIRTVPHQYQNCQQHTHDVCCTHNTSSHELSRRSWLKSTHHSFTVAVISVVTISTTTTIIPTTAAYALQPRNEPLCSTGLFEHFMEYKCTPIGDIQDEGMSKGLTSVDEQTTNSLMSKLGLDHHDTTTTTTTYSESNGKENETSLTNNKNIKNQPQNDKIRAATW